MLSRTLSKEGVAVMDEAVVILPVPPDDMARHQWQVRLDETLIVVDRASSLLPQDRQQLRMQTCLRAARLNLEAGDHSAALTCYQRAIDSATNEVTHQVVSALTRDVMDVLPERADAFVSAVMDGTVSWLRRAALGSVHEAQAFYFHAHFLPAKTVTHVVRALGHGSQARTNRGLWKMAAFSLLGRKSAKPVDMHLGEALLEQAAQGDSLFISPHFDDAVLSCGGLLAQLSRRKANSTLLTVFTADAHDPAHVSPLAHELRATWGDVDDPYAVRAREDMRVENRWGLHTSGLVFPKPRVAMCACVRWMSWFRRAMTCAPTMKNLAQ